MKKLITCIVFLSIVLGSFGCNGKTVNKDAEKKEEAPKTEQAEE
jgi:hypothetical protein